MSANQQTERLLAFVDRGDDAGKLLFPHRHKDGKYVVSPTKFEADYARLDSLDDVIRRLEGGLKLRMSNKKGGVSAPRLIDPKNIYRPIIDR